VQDDITTRNEIPHQERIGNIAEPHLHNSVQILGQMPQVPNLTPAVVPGECADAMTFPQQQLDDVAAYKAGRSGNQNAMRSRHFRCIILITAA